MSCQCPLLEIAGSVRTSNRTHRGDNGDEVDFPVSDLLGVTSPLSMEIETHLVAGCKCWWIQADLVVTVISE